MPPASDWRSASTAEKLMSLDRPQFAAEFLRRNPDYSEDYRSHRIRSRQASSRMPPEWKGSHDVGV